ncbi:type VI secretion system baseplate subunit TssK [Reyranella sp.]|uniref:type VI secretion system baseplate subunit TssK n=1 Tax=Reyranella sp. TaxID=1929291 RepID=UPI00121E3D84|nr:type VI secretion system baseplate subunit TssK [Reyranella sp.]TAJ83511.1 MAG: type VI secretion system baseplate subunit TssK [Reyranella sp.]
MTWSNRVVWLEGMFLRAQHFQQQDRWFENQLRDRTTSLRSHAWGLTEGAINRNLLTTGQFALASGSGVFEDGTPFALPGDADQPAPLDLPETTRNAVVYLALPIRQAGAVEVTGDGSTEGRYEQKPFEAYDTHSGSPQPAEVQVGRLRLRYMLETDNRAGYHGIGLARVVEVGADRRVILDDQWIPPALTCAAAPPLSGWISELSGMLNQRGEALAARLTAPGTRGVADVSDFLLLQSINRAQKLMAHWAGDGNVHPVDLYAALVQMAGDLATFTEATRRPSEYPTYRHADLQRSFALVIADLRRSLSTEIDQTAIQIPLQKRAYGIQVGTITDRSILRSSSFVLVVQADMPTESVRRLFPAQVKIGAVEHIRELVNVALPGIAVRPLPVAPRQLPFYAGATYFELDRNSAHWKELQSSGGFAVHVSGDFPNLNTELWAIRG